MKKTPTAEQIFCFYIITLCFMFFGYIVVMSYKTGFTLPQETGMIMAAVISISTGVCGYMIGSNTQSKVKDDMIKQAMETTPPSAQNTNTSTLTLNWLGSFDTVPPNPGVNDAYINTSENKNYFWDGNKWAITTQKPA